MAALNMCTRGLKDSVHFLSCRKAPNKVGTVYLPSIYIVYFKSQNLELLEQNITWISQETQRLYQNILNLVRQYKGRLNFHDSLIALVAKEFEIKYIATFDTDFKDIDWLTINNLTEDK